MTTGETWLITIVGGAVAAVLATWALAAFNAAFKEKVWRPLWRWIRWPFTLRITTTRKLAFADAAAARLERENARLRTDVEKASNLGAAHVAAIQALAKQELEAAEARAKRESLEQVRGERSWPRRRANSGGPRGAPRPWLKSRRNAQRRSCRPSGASMMSRTATSSYCGTRSPGCTSAT